jgi:hypothetical protein
MRKPTGVNPKQNLLRIPNVNYHAAPNYHHVIVQCMINAVQDVAGIAYLVFVQTTVASLQLNLSAVLRVERIENTHTIPKPFLGSAVTTRRPHSLIQLILSGLSGEIPLHHPRRKISFFLVQLKAAFNEWQRTLLPNAKLVEQVVVRTLYQGTGVSTVTVENQSRTSVFAGTIHPYRNAATPKETALTAPFTLEHETQPSCYHQAE